GQGRRRGRGWSSAAERRLPALQIRDAMYFGAQWPCTTISICQPPGGGQASLTVFSPVPYSIFSSSRSPRPPPPLLPPGPRDRNARLRRGGGRRREPCAW
ncbi:unnamed protein product, partial [Prorocentrum cordatum]